MFLTYKLGDTIMLLPSDDHARESHSYIFFFEACLSDCHYLTVKFYNKYMQVIH